MPFCERARELGVDIICAHKGLTYVVDTGSPRDLGPAARAFPDLTFVAYHSGYEMPFGDNPPEGPYTEETADVGVNRMVTTMKQAGLPPGSNVYAELGSTWFCLVRRPREAAHVLGKLLVAYGEDNILWGTDSTWYGPTQQILDAFRAFRIPPELQDEFGYPELTPQIKQKILSSNAAALYGIDLDDVARTVADDDLAWARAVIAQYEAAGGSVLV
jgi:predicted TIM-barrel fold metal-dependent hydrolase